MMGLPCGKEIMIVGPTMWTQSTSVTDRQTETDKITITKTVQRIASHSKNVSKSLLWQYTLLGSSCEETGQASEVK